ncbi:MAG TPA: hypothetical protein VF832_01350 [Longimicrobiales bacterium]
MEVVVRHLIGASEGGMAVHGLVATAALAGLAALAGGASAQQPTSPDSGGAAVVSAPAPAPASLADSTPAPARRRQFGFDGYVHDILGPGAWVGVAAGGAIAQVETSPTQWGTGASGFGKRVASSAGQLIAQETVRHGLAAVLDRSTDYQRCRCKDFGGRVGNAFTETFTDRDREGHRAFSVPRIAGTVAGSFAPLLWWPGATVKGSETAAGVSLLLTLGGNVVSEFVHLLR